MTAFSGARAIITDCTGCGFPMIVEDTPLTEYEIAIGTRRTGRWWHGKCLNQYLNGYLVPYKRR